MDPLDLLEVLTWFGYPPDCIDVFVQVDGKAPYRIFNGEDIPLVHEVLLTVGETRQRLAKQQDLELEAVHSILGN